MMSSKVELAKVKEAEAFAILRTASLATTMRSCQVLVLSRADQLRLAYEVAPTSITVARSNR
jgi:hypothetical protein